jgi:ATP-dependent helicase/nuclease subunit A
VVTGSSVALAAGAGCGKTTVLTARYLSDLEGDAGAGGGRPLRSIVALTFTNKAARELRKRIRQRCRDRLSEGRDGARWRSILRGLEAAPIGTFHEFCGDWLRRHAALAGVDPDFTILDETIAGTIRDEALGGCMRRWLAEAGEDSDLVALAVEFGLNRVRQALAGLIARRSAGDITPWADRSVEEIVARWKAAWDGQGRAARLLKVVNAARRCAALLAAHESTHPVMRERRAFLLEHLSGLDPREAPDELLDAIRGHAMVQGAGNKADWPSPSIYEQVKSHFERLRKEIDAFGKGSSWDEDATREAAELGRRLARLVGQLDQAYRAAKRARGGLDFDDMLILTRDLLRDHPELAGDADEGIPTRYLVDEFQDTDEVQGEILRRLGGPALNGGRLFLVGDDKQSIYRFRGAKPRIFQEFRAGFAAAGRHALTENYRSVPAILDFVNALFADVFAETGEGARLVPGPKTFPATSGPAVEFLWTDEPVDEDAGGTRLATSDQRKIEARWIARRLHQRLNEGWKVRDPGSGKLRDAGAGDIALLFRSMASVGDYEAALAAEGFDYHVVGGSAFYAQQEIHDLINVLSVIEDPRDVVSLAGALRSPFFCVSDDGLYWLSMSRFGDLADGLQHADEIDELSSPDGPQAWRARALLLRWRDLKDRVPIAALVDRVLDESGYEAALLGEYLGARKRANARKLVRMARQFDAHGGFTVADFVNRLRADLRRPPREEQAATTDEAGTSLRLMSIHQAKGLEFPIVVLPDLNRKSGDDRDFVGFHPDLGPLVRVAGDPAPGEEAGPEEKRQSLGWQTYQAIEQGEEDAEALRLFYVATTRARDALILSAGLSPEGKATSRAMALVAERFDRTSGVCVASLPAGWTEPRVHVTRQCPPASGVAASGRVGRPPLIEIAERIDATPVAPAAQPDGSRRDRPRFVDLDPARVLPPTLARLDRLVRAILADPRALSVRDLPRVAAEAARRQRPAAPALMIDQALRRLDPWLEGALGRMLDEAVESRRGLAWTIAWPFEAPDARRTVYAGTTEFLLCDHRGEWSAVVVALAEASIRHERLRLQLALRTASVLGCDPAPRGWLLRLGPDGALHREERLDPDDIGDLEYLAPGTTPSDSDRANDDGPPAAEDVF